MTAHQLERCLSGLFPNSKALPFGSSVNGFGGAGCDLDIVFVYDDAEVSTESRLVFQSKGCGGGGIRSQTQRQMELLGDLVQVFLPGCSMVKRILQARVPIVKYTQEITGVDCDLSLTNMCAVYMSELLYLYGELDHRVRPLVFAVKQWAQACGLTSNVPGRWITNFSLALLVLFYFQRVKILPSLDALILAARPEDVKFVDDINCTFLRDVSKLCRSADDSTGSKSIAELLCGFFDFYTKFDFATAGVSICTGSSIIKPDYSPIYIVNPLERSLNVSKNVSPEEVERLRVEVRNALWCLEGGGNLPQLLLKGGTTAPPIQHHHHYQRAMKHSRMVTVKDLFTEQS
ncbi:hypothetical protein AAG570_010631 [Ranatra chinensis]|uniref:PAP-associated domain-containing protein n=1 Tax=Ranatra chinensis TaxID=642074 RepID=A0ABD0YQA6_9HEMI